ncbi:hypothetical protein R50073_39970 [Maricurvus nonylphenolicus]|uniref:hypothetical protein n=1 Tax=Maricurvus nonylphenolicus TaxID=1008307 RepID=UPI0036F279E4
MSQALPGSSNTHPSHHAGWIASLCLLLLSACSTSTLTPNPNSSQLTELLNGKTLQERLEQRAEQPLDWSLPDDQVMTLNQDMHDFLDAYVPRRANPTVKLEALLNAVMHSGLLGVDYNPQATYSASDAFFYREANCLSFSMMFIAMAREVGLSASFNQVSIPPSWEMLGQQTLVNYKHINAKVKTRDGHHIVDLNIKEYKSHYRQRRASDDQAQAQYYNNRAMEFLANGNTHSAYRYMRKALELAPKQGDLWGNFATIYRREKLFTQAEIAYQQALTLDPNNHVAASNLSRLYQQQGNEELANYYQQQVIKFRMRNPYHRFFLAEQALKRSDVSQARRHINFALKHNKKEPRFHALADKIQQAEFAELLAKESY